MSEGFRDLYERTGSEIFIKELQTERDEWRLRRVEEIRPRDDLEAIGIEHDDELIYGILRERTGDEREFKELEEDGRVLEIYDPQDFLDGYDDFVDRYNRILRPEKDDIEYLEELEEFYPNGGFGW